MRLTLVQALQAVLLNTKSRRGVSLTVQSYVRQSSTTWETTCNDHVTWGGVG